MSTDDKQQESAPVLAQVQPKWSAKLAKMTLSEMLYRALIGEEGAWPEGGAAH